MPFTYSILAAFIPMIIFLLLIWRFDKYEREPFTKVFKHFLWGAFGAIFLGIVFSSILNFTFKQIVSHEKLLSFIGAVIIAPLIEEPVKAIFLLRSYKNNYFDNLTDGLIYGGAIGLGFGMTENLLYFSIYNETFFQWFSVVIMRSVFSAVMHAIATATVGAFLAKAKFSLNSSIYIYMFWGFTIAISFHAIWNFSMSFGYTYLLGLIFMIFLIVSFLFLFNYSLKTERKIIENELLDEKEIYQYSYFLKTKSSSIDDLGGNFLNHSQQKKYTYFTTRLAFRKFQVRNCTGKQKEIYLSDIENYREKIQTLLNNIQK